VRTAAGSAREVYRSPDVIISLLNNTAESPLVVEVISPLAGKLRINQLFRQSLNQAPGDKVDEWQASLERAALLIKCIQQRNNTIVRLMQNLAQIQRTYILRGDAHLDPITRANLAEKLDVHESTVSRAVSNKAVQLPNGRIVPLSKFFDRSLHIRTVLKQIIAEEAKPLTDTQLAKLLKKHGYPIARRTVAKYRAMEGILPAHLRV
jgi:RNA polymerase sigma-54 factor